MVDSEIVDDDSRCWWCGSWGKARVDEVYYSDKACLKSLDFEELVDDYIDNYDEGHPTNEQEIERWAKEQVNNLPWEKVITVSIVAL